MALLMRMALLMWDGPIDEDGLIAVGWPYCCGVALLLGDGPIDVHGPIAVGWPY